MRFVEEFFGKYDERSETIERAAGDMAFKVLWVLLLIVVAFVSVLMNGGMGSTEILDITVLMTVASLMIALFVKYLYCWINNIARIRVMVKFGAALVFSFAFMMGMALLME
jgi:hypothetical protein